MNFLHWIQKVFEKNCVIAGTVLLEHTYDIMDSNGWLRAATSYYYDLQFEMCHVWCLCAVVLL